MRHLIHKLFLASLLILQTYSNALWAMGSPKPEPTPTPTPKPEPTPTPKPDPKPTPTPTPTPSKGFLGTSFIEPKAINFSFKAESGLGVTPSCLKKSGFELLVLDPGHDDSSNSRRSDAKVRGGNGKYVFLWPEVHEGNLTMVTSYLAYEYLLGNPSLSERDRSELKTMIRFTRLPGEKTFGQYEKDSGYGPLGGSITSGIDNRKERVNIMMANHRPYDASTGKASSTRSVDYSGKTLMLSVHANSTDYFDEGDLSWMIPPKNPESPSSIKDLVLSLRKGFSLEFGDFLDVQSSDSSEVAKLKQGAEPSVRETSIRTNEHEQNLAMLSSVIKTPNKVLLEGFVMNGKMGHLAQIDIKNSSARKKLEFYRSGKLMATYDVAELYMAYARSIVKGIQEKTDCQP
ncbi:MAG: hypothetical protein KA116_12920 [Proteobacteria bacterium]|nr:hypothetical protein [Pseudomonadota bacterium]